MEYGVPNHRQSQLELIRSTDGPPWKTSLSKRWLISRLWLSQYRLPILDQWPYNIARVTVVDVASPYDDDDDVSPESKDNNK